MNKEEDFMDDQNKRYSKTKKKKKKKKNSGKPRLEVITETIKDITNYKRIDNLL